MQNGSRRRILHSAFCILHFAAAAAAASSLTVDKRTLSLDDSLTITLTLDDAFASAGVPQLPLQNLALDGPPSQSTSFEWINGQSSRRKILRWSAHPLVAAGALVGPVVLHGDGGQVETLPRIAIDVLPDRAMQLTDPDAVLHELLATGRDPIFLLAEADRKEVYAGEEVVVTWVLYNGTNVEQYGLADLPKLDDFWAEELDVRNEQPQQVNLGGTVVQRVPIRRVALFPLRSGTLVVQPLAINGAIMRRMRGPADPFGMFEGTVVEVHRRSPPLTIVARPVPPGSPVAAVGDVTMNCSMPLQQNGGPVVVDVTMSGRANLRAVAPPKFAKTIDGSVQIVEGKVSVDRTREDATMTRRWRYLLFPAARGMFAVPPLTSAILTPAGERRELRCEEHVLPVERAAEEAPARTAAPSRDVRAVMHDARWPIAVVCVLLLAVAFALPRVQRSWRVRRELRSIDAGDLLPSLDAWIAARGVDPQQLVREPSDRGDAYRALRSLLDERVGATAKEARRRARDVVAEVIETSTPPTER
jgi:hypothetical protein